MEHGVPAAVLVSAEQGEARLSHEDIVEGMRALRQQVKREKVSVKELIEEGRRY